MSGLCNILQLSNTAFQLTIVFIPPIKALQRSDGFRYNACSKSYYHQVHCFRMDLSYTLANYFRPWQSAWRKDFELTPTRQATSSAKRQRQVAISTTHFDRAPSGLLSVSPNNLLTRFITRLQRHGASCKAITEDVAHVIPDVFAVEIVCKDGLAHIRLEDTIFDRRDLNGNTTGQRVTPEGLAVGGGWGNSMLWADASTYRPEVDGTRAFIADDGTTDSMDCRKE